MSYQVHLRSAAASDLSEAATWYEEQVVGLGKDFLNQVEETLTAIQTNPLQYPVVHKQVHRALIRRFPFSVFYLIEDDAIIVIAILHASRHPQKWKTRT